MASVLDHGQLRLQLKKIFISTKIERTQKYRRGTKLQNVINISKKLKQIKDY